MHAENLLAILCDYFKLEIWLTKDGCEIRSRKEDKPPKKLEPSCLSCRFRSADKTILICTNEETNRCFEDPIVMHIEEVKMRSFSCSFYEFNLNFDERFGKENRSFHTGTTGGLSPNDMTGGAGKVPYNADDCD